MMEPQVMRYLRREPSGELTKASIQRAVERITARSIRDGRVYFIGEENGGPVKVGFTSAPVEMRLCELQTGNPRRLEVISSFEGNAWDENAVHVALAGDRMCGEWFRRTPRLELLISFTRRGRIGLAIWLQDPDIGIEAAPAPEAQR
jgi:hypothetical protein